MLLQIGSVRGPTKRGRNKTSTQTTERAASPKEEDPVLARSAPAVISTNLIKKRKQWSKLSMNLAVDAVKKGGTTITRAVLEHGVPRTTLQDRISGRVFNGCKPGRSHTCHNLKKRI